MDPRRGTLGFLLFLLNPLNLCFAIQKVFLDKRIGPDADMTPVCTNETDNIIENIYCKVNKRNSAFVCSVGFVGQRFVSKCDPRITLTSLNQTVFMHLKGLTPEDSGMYNCECYKKTEYLEVNLNITVEVNERGNSNDDKETDINMIIICSSIIACVLICGVILSYIYKMICCRRRAQPREGEEMDTYAALQQPSKDLYQTIVKVDSAGGSGSRRQRLHREGDYENVQNFAK